MKEKTKWMTVKDACKIIGLSYNATRLLVKYGEIPGYKFGGAIRIKEKDLLEYIEKSKVA